MNFHTAILGTLLSFFIKIPWYIRLLLHIFSQFLSFFRPKIFKEIQPRDSPNPRLGTPKSADFLLHFIFDQTKPRKVQKMRKKAAIQRYFWS